MTTQGQGHSLIIVQGHSDSTYSDFFSSETTRPSEAKFYMESPWNVGNENLFNMTMPIYSKELQKSSFSEPRGWWSWNLVYSIGYLTTINCFKSWPWVDLYHFYFLMLLYGWQLIQPWVLMYFQVCSNSASPQHSGERYRTKLLWFNIISKSINLYTHTII